MNKKIFTLLLVAVFALAQFSMVSALPTVDAVVTVEPLPTFSKIGALGTVDFSMELPGDPVQNVLSWWRVGGLPWNADYCLDLTGNVNGLTAATGSYPYGIGSWVDQQVAEFSILVINVDDIAEDSGNPAWDDDCEAHVAFMNAAPAQVAQASTFIDGQPMKVLQGFPPSDVATFPPTNPVVCNTFEYWALASDNRGIPVANGYSGFGGWNQSITGTFAPPAPEGPANELLSWEYAFPATASGAWTFAIAPEDVAENPSTYINMGPGGPWAGSFRTALAIAPAELEDCKDFTDTAGHADETYIRYLADLELISGFADGTFGPDTTLTRAEAATLFEKANGVTDADPGFGTPPAAGSACDFSDVSAADWFAGWVWQACDDGFMNGIGGGLFDPNNLLTRGQVVTVMNNIATALPAYTGLWTFASFFESPVLIYDWWGNPAVMRTGAWTDVSIGAYYATPVIQAYGWGVAEGTSDTTFSPDAPATRGEFAKWLYRALSRTE